MQINFSLAQIVQNQFSTFDIDFTDDVKIAENYAVGFGYSVEEKKIGCSISYQLEADEKPFLKIEVTCVYNIEDPSWKDILQDGAIVLPKGFATHLAVISSGTTRGILFANTRDAKYSNYLLSLLDITKIITDDVTIQIN